MDQVVFSMTYLIRYLRILYEKVTNHSSESKNKKRVKQNWDKNKDETFTKWIITKSKHDSKEIGRSRINLLSTCHLEIVRG